MLTNIIQPQNISLQTIRDEIAKYLHIAVDNILRFEYWPHQLWAHIEGIGGRILSYRSLPAWLHQIIFAIRDCTNLDQLWELGLIIKVEKQRFEKYYAKAYVQELREIWAERRDELREEEKRLAPIRKHRQDGQKWLESCQGVMAECESTSLLQNLYPIMEAQSRKFEDLPEIFSQLLTSYQQRWVDLGGF